jgi:hypothetical protein
MLPAVEILAVEDWRPMSRVAFTGVGNVGGEGGRRQDTYEKEPVSHEQAHRSICYLTLDA